MIKIEILENGNVKLTIPMSFRHCAGRKRIIVPDDSEKLVDPLVLNLARAFRWQELIDSGTYSNAIELARAVGKDTAYVARTVRLTLLAPEIIRAILHGTLKKSISMETLRKSWPENWEEQKEIFWSYLKLLHLAVWIQIPDRFFLCPKSKSQVLWIFLIEANFLRFFQGSSMVIFSVFDSNPRLLFWAILSSKV